MTQRMDAPLIGQVAVVTGAGRGIGRAIAIGVADAGATVCCAARSEVEIRQTVDEIRNRGAAGLAVPTDVTVLASVKALFESVVRECGGLDVLFINAGTTTSGPSSVESTDPQEWRRVIEVNLLGAYHCAREAVPHLRRRGGGKIILVGSGLGHRAVHGTSAYACSKAGVRMLSRVLAQEVRDYDICVNELIPGPVETTLASTTSRFVGEFIGEWYKQPADVVPLAIFLASQPNHGPTGQTFSLTRRDL